MEMEIRKPKFENQGTDFQTQLKDEVNNYFEKNKIKRTGNYQLYIKTTTFISLLVVLYYILVFVRPTWWISLPLCAMLGAALAGVGFNIMHDAVHGSFSSRKWVNKLFGYSLNLMGGISCFWEQKHNIAHHTYTNIEGFDEDIKIPLMRMHENQKWKKCHRFQFLYWPFFYCTTYFLWIYASDYLKYFSGKIGVCKLPKMPLKEHIIFWFSKIMNFGIFVVLPIIFVGFLPFLVGYFTMIVTCGFIISIVFQLAHVVEGTENPVPENGKINQEWAIHEVQTTSDFATGNWVITWFVGGLNFQVIHHLFPKVSHVHYKNLQPYVKNLCKDFGLHYNEKKTFSTAVISHVRRLYTLGLG